MYKKDLLGLEELDKKEIDNILTKADTIRNSLDNGVRDFDLLKGKQLVTLFYENSTRTLTSFFNAGKLLGASVKDIPVKTSSVQKGESLIDTGKTLDALKTDLIIIRHSVSGAPEFLAKNVNAKVVNAGDGMHAHPTQALLDMLTLKRYFGKLEGLTIAIVGDIAHSRVVRSNIYGLTKMGANINLYAPKTLIAKDIEKMGNVKVCKTLDEAITNVDGLMGLRIQLERQQSGLFPSLSEYAKYYGVNREKLKLIKDNGIILHPGPVNRNVELSSDVVDCDRSMINEQVTNGLAVRMAVLTLMLEEK